jgi:hypothetical protein
MMRREGMHNARIEAGLAERPLHRLVIDARHLDGHDGIGQPFRPANLRDILHHPSQVTCGMLHGRRFHENLAVKVAEQPLGPAFGAVHGDHAKVLGPDRPHALLDLPRRLADKPFFGTRENPLFGSCDHLRVSQLKVAQIPPIEALGWSFS